MIKKILKNKKTAKKTPSRITNDTVAEHREKILAGGRKHKYPIQYTKHKLVWNTVFISVGILVLAVAGVWAQLYVWQDTGGIAYRITQTLPLPVAMVDGQPVSYGTYLKYYRSTIASLESVDRRGGEDVVNFQKQRSIDQAVKIAYSQKLARELEVTVSEEEVDEVLQRLKRSLSDAAIEAAIRKTFGLSMAEYRQNLRDSILINKVAFEIDSEASEKAETIAAKISAGKTMEEAISDYGQSVRLVNGLTVARDNADSVTELVVKSGLSVGQTSGALRSVSGDAYYIIKLESITDKELTYSYISIPLTEMKKRLEDMKKDDKISYFIKVD